MRTSLAALALVFGVSCVDAPARELEPREPALGMAAAPSAGMHAFAHLEALVAMGARVPGSAAANEAASYVRRELAALGLAVEELGRADESSPARVLLAEIPAAVADPEPSAPRDLIVLAARYDAERFETFEFVGANDGASGAALLLVLARALVERPLPYRTWLAFLEGDRHADESADPLSGLHASRRLLGALREREGLERVRLAVYWDQVADRDLTISRDLYSDRVHRDTFFREAERLGLAAHFPTDAAFDPVLAGHRAFWAADVRRVVALMDARFGGDQPPGALWHTGEDALSECSAESLDAVLRVSEAGLRANAARLHKIDAYTRRPVPPVESGPVLPAENVQAPLRPADAEDARVVQKELP